jgi:CubicO group peptidase (beta-lactamase class C family)
MKNFFVQILSITLMLVINSACSNHKAQKSGNSDVFEKVDTLFSQWDNTDSPGCALAVIKDGKIFYKRGYGMADLEHNIAISPNTVFYVGSVSKQFVAMCLLLLEEEGKLSVDDDIRKYLPEFPVYQVPITIRHLIHHTSGIQDYLLLWTLSGKDYLDYMPENEVYKMLCSQEKLDFIPGEKQSYSNSGYFLSAMIIRRVSGKSLRDYAEEKIFKPLGMTSSQFNHDNKRIIKNRAFGYVPIDKDTFGNLIMRFDLVGSGGLYSTVEDLFQWDQNFYHNKLGETGQSLINKMVTNGRTSDGKEVNYAFALINGIYRGCKTIQHSGSLGGYRSHIIRFPDQQFSVIILSNLSSFEPGSLAYKVADIFIDEHLLPGLSNK